jgi:hypothetical protein
MIANRVKHFLVFPALLVAGAILLHSCGTSSAPKRTEHDDIMDATDRIIAQRERLDAESRQLKIDMDRWQADCENLKRRELQFIKALNDQQLKLYSDYEESHKSGNAGKKELCLRNLGRALSREQQLELVNQSTAASYLDTWKMELIARNQEIAQKREKNYRDLTVLIQVAESYYGRKRKVDYSDVLSGVQSSMQQWQQTIQQNQQRMDMWSINTSLRDIAGSLRDLKY